jgi:hypothetical protein
MRRCTLLILLLASVSALASATLAQSTSQFEPARKTGRFSDQKKDAQDQDAASSRRKPRMEVLAPAEWRRIDRSIETALAYLATQQSNNGALASNAAGQPAVTSLGIMAYLSAGHQPGEERYGAIIERAIDFALDCQRDDGLFSYAAVTMPVDNPWGGPSHAATYNHAITGLMLGEVLGQTNTARAQRIRPAIERALEYTRQMQLRRKRFAVDNGGLRYIRDVNVSGTGGGDADLSVTAWHLMFYRSAKNAGFDVPVNYVEEALQFVHRCYDPQSGGFRYSLYTGGTYITRAMTGAGVLSLFLAGKYDADIEARSGQWLIDHRFSDFRPLNTHDRYFYSAYYCSQAALMLGGTYWEQFYPDLAATLLSQQNADGSWRPESDDADYGQTYSTSLSVLSLTPPYQLLPIYQR